MKILVCGGRDFSDTTLLVSVLETLGITHLVHGGARGADTLAGHWARLNNVPTTKHMADWATYGRRAGMIRNALMLSNHPDLELVVAFPGGSGTANMVSKARAAGLKVLEVKP